MDVKEVYDCNHYNA